MKKLSIALIVVAAFAVPLAGQVGVDSTASTWAALQAPTTSLSFSHTMSSQPNGLLIVAVSINIAAAGSGCQVSSVTDDTIAFSFIGALNNTGTRSRIEMWSLLAPPSGTHTITVTLANTGTSVVDVVAGAVSFIQVDQTTPLETFASATGRGGSTPIVSNINSADGEVIMDVFATTGNMSVTPGSGQIQQWNMTTGNNASDVTGASSTKAGSANATMSWAFVGNTQEWVMGAVSVRPAIKTAVELRDFEVHHSAAGNVLQWQSAYEVHNLGFNVYREQNGERIKLNRSPIAGSALMSAHQDVAHVGKQRSYSFVDRGNGGTASYWLEDIDMRGTRTLHGPVYAEDELASQLQPNAPFLSSVGAAQLPRSQTKSAVAHFMPRSPYGAGGWPAFPALQHLSPQASQFELASRPAIKISVTSEGWYELSQPELVAAGFDTSRGPRQIRLYAEGREQPVKIVQSGSPHVGLGPNDFVEFYGTGLDTPSTGTRVYWLVQDFAPGLHVRTEPGWGYEALSALPSFPYTLEWKDRTTFLAALTNAPQGNFFGEIIATDPLQHSFTVTSLDASSSATVVLSVSLQGVIDQQAHDVRVNLNGADLGDMQFMGMALGTQSFAVPQGLLQAGTNLLTLTPEDGDSDISLVNYVDLTYPRLFIASADQLKFTASAGSSVRVTGFSNANIRLVDITNPNAADEVSVSVLADGSGYDATLRVPGRFGEKRTLLAFGPDAVAQPAAIAPNTPSSWFMDRGRQIVIISYPDFIPALAPLVSLRQAQGYSVGVVDVDSVYDEFGYGEHGPGAIRGFLGYAAQHWQTKPQYVLLVGGASMDPRNFLGFGDLDFVPTEMIATQELTTASDGALVDFQNTGIESIAIGRLPVQTLAQAENVVGKIVGYETGGTAPWQMKALFVADHDPNVAFESYTQAAEAEVPNNVNATTILLANTDASTARSEMLEDWQQGQLLINYVGHGSEQIWDQGLLSDDDTNSLGNGTRLPVVITADCLNGFFQDVYAASLGPSLLLAENGGAVGVIASSGLTDSEPEAVLDQALLGNLFRGAQTTLGAALRNAKSHVSDQDVRRTYMLFGDPAMRLASNSGSGSAVNFGNVAPAPNHLFRPDVRAHFGPAAARLLTKRPTQ